jgi:hypothetical protein
MLDIYIYQFWLRSPITFWESEDYKSLGLETYNLNDSVTLCHDFLLFQFNQSDELVSDFLSTLYSVLDRKTCKKDCLEVMSPPTSGQKLVCTSRINYEEKGGISQFSSPTCKSARIIDRNAGETLPQYYARLKISGNIHEFWSQHSLREIELNGALILVGVQPSLGNYTYPIYCARVGLTPLCKTIVTKP